MSIRQFVGIIAAAALLGVGRAIFGERFVIPYFVTLALVIAGAWILFWRDQARLRDRLGALDEATQDEVLVYLETAEFRPQLAESLGRDVPRVPLRAEREVFRYPAEGARMTRWVRYASTFLALFFLVGWLSDVLLDRNRFVGPATPWWDSILPTVLLGAGAVLMRGCEAAQSSTVEVTEEGLAQHIPGCASRFIPWSAVASARRSELGRTLTVRSADVTIAVADTVQGYGRLVNLVATRLPTSARWEAV